MALNSCAAIVAIAAAFLFIAPPSRAEIVVPSGFAVDVPIDDISKPTAMEFASDGRIFVAQRDGRILVFDGISDPSPTVFAAFQSRVHIIGDRGLLGIALDPGFPAEPYVYITYTRDALVGGPDPPPPLHNDTCPANQAEVGCVVSARIARLEMDPVTGVAKTGTNGLPLETWNITDWCQQFTGHSIGDLEFDSSGALYAGGGDGASFTFADYGQAGGNPCGDPEWQGGSLRAQDLRTTGDPTGYDGTIIRVDPDTGAALSDNPLFGASEAAARRVVAYGLRNPFRFEFLPGTDDLYIQDTGSDRYEEIDRLPPSSTVVPNFGWPCYEGDGEGSEPLARFDNLGLSMCESMYSSPPADLWSPFFAYRHSGPVYPGDTCPLSRGVAGTGLSFHQGNHFPTPYAGALFFANAASGCIWVMSAGPGGVPDPSTTQLFAVDDEGFEFTPVDIVEGPDGALYMPSFWENEIVRIRYFPDNSPPTARLDATPRWGPAPLTVDLDASASSDADEDPITYRWDLDGDGQYDDATGVEPSLQRIYTDPVNVEVGVRASDSYGTSDTERVLLRPGNLPPTPSIDTPLTDHRWAVGGAISFAGSATDPDEGALGPASLDWEITLEHCQVGCHTHPLIEFDGKARGVAFGPEHEPGSYLSAKLTATDARGLSVTVERRLDPRLVDLQVESSPPGIELALDAQTGPAPLGGTLISGARANVVAPESVVIRGVPFDFVSWSNGGARSHTATVREPTTLEAIYAPRIVGLQLDSRPPGIRLQLNGSVAPAPFDRYLERGSPASLWAPRRVKRDGRILLFGGWSDGGARSHTVTVADPSVLTARYKLRPRPGGLGRPGTR